MSYSINFRTLQAVTIATTFGYWLVRFATNPYHMHKTMLIMSIVSVIISEVSYRAGKAELSKMKPMRQD
jgi:hypothetical protein